MFLRILSKKNWFRDANGKKINVLKRSDGSQKVLCFKWENGIKLEEKEVILKMIPKEFRKDKELVLHNLISIDQDKDLIFAPIGEHKISFLKVDSDGIISPESFEFLSEDDTILSYEDEDYSYCDIVSVDSFDKEIDENSGKLSYHIMSVPDGYGVIVNDFFVVKE